MRKRLISHPLFQAVIGRAIGAYMLVVTATTRWRRVNEALALEVWTGAGPVIACAWHGRFFLLRATWRFSRGAQPVKMLISLSREGAIVTHAAHAIGTDVVRGSAAKGEKDKGGFAATREMLRHLDARGCVAMTPDGPRGPRMRAGMGPIQLAKLSGAPLLCLAWSTRWRRALGSWDRFILPAPFGRGAIVYGELIRVPRDADNAAMEAARAALERELNRISAEADTLVGVDVITPAEPRATRDLHPAA